jgi:hypothetical protein
MPVVLAFVPVAFGATSIAGPAFAAGDGDRGGAGREA